MTIETLLYPIHVSQSDDKLLAIAELCVNEDKHLSVLLFGESLSLPPMTMGDTAGAEIWARQMAGAESTLKQRCTEFSTLLNKNGARSDVKYVLSDGVFVDDVVGSHAVYTDLAIAQRPRAKDNIDSFGKRIFHGILINAGKPLLVFDESPPGNLNCKTILIAWDGKRAASRAVTDSLPLLKAASNVHVLSVDPDQQLASASEQIDWDLPTFLARHGVNVTVDTRDSMGAKVSSVIQQRAMEVGADLIVSGSYSRSRLRERIFGGTTIELLNDCPISLLMSH